MAAVAWVLNLDADLELGGGARYAPTKSVLAAMAVHAEVLAKTLLEPGDVWVRDGVTAKGLPGRAFCPTPRALAALERAGARPEPHPSFEVLRRVNARSFCRSGLPGARFVTTLDDALAKLATAPPIGNGWRIKRNFGMAGRGQRVGADLAFVRAGIGEGGVQIEPNVEIEAEYAIHGMVGEELRLGRLVRQHCDARGRWTWSEPCDDARIVAVMRGEATAVAGELRDAGYFGPFGVDAFAYRGGFQPRSEINARYSMAFPLGFYGRASPHDT